MVDVIAHVNMDNLVSAAAIVVLRAIVRVVNHNVDGVMVLTAILGAAMIMMVMHQLICGPSNPMEPGRTSHVGSRGAS